PRRRAPSPPDQPQVCPQTFSYPPTPVLISPNTRPDCRQLLISYRGTARFISGRQKGHVVAERRRRCPSGADRPPTSKLSKSKSSMEPGAKRRQAPQPLVYAFDRV